MHDALGYFELPYDYRKFSHKLLNFSLTYAFSENYIQPFSHDEAVHGKRSLFCKMFGNKADKAANLRALFAYMICHPGRKLNFMGNDFGQLSEWSYNNEIEWRLLGFPLHRGINACVHDLNNLYINEPALWQNDSNEKSFSWIDCDNAGQNVLSFVRYAKNKDEMLVVICNFSDTGYDEYKVGVPRFTEYYEIFNSDSEIYCGGGRLNTGKIMPVFEEWNGQPFYISIALPSCSVMIFKPKFYKNTERSGDKIC